MAQTIALRCSPQQATNEDWLQNTLRKQLGEAAVGEFHILKRSIDSRKNPIVVNLQVEVFSQGEERNVEQFPIPNNDVSKAQSVVIVGAGPAGLYAALELIALGMKPILLERGKPVKERRRDLVKIIRDHEVDANSNYCFGEGGAGTYSDGKLYTRSKKRGDVRHVLELFVAHGAAQNILVNAHPHIGTNKLPEIITRMRQTIERCGGEVHFSQKVVSFLVEDQLMKGVATDDGKKWLGPVVLATGHSARDVFRQLHKQQIAIEAKPFALGVRVEHPQELIDQIQYHGFPRGDYLPPASYSLVHQVEDRGVYSFCMCPGGIIAPCATENGEVVTNGWSPSKRNNPYANSGIVVPVDESDWSHLAEHGPLAAMAFQAEVETQCWDAAGRSQKAPAQRLVDFVQGRKSKTLPNCSYGPGLASARVDLLLPKEVSTRLQKAFGVFSKKLKGFMHPNAVVVAPESRTSSPVRIPRDRATLEHTEIKGFYPCGEGAGYAGGIVSAALDGIKIARAVFEQSLATSDKNRVDS